MRSNLIRMISASLILFIIFPWVIMATLAGLWQGIDWLGTQLWPVVLNGGERGFLSGLWLASILLTGGMFYVAIRRRKFSYAIGGATAVASLLLVSNINMPLTPEAGRRWMVGHQLEQREWLDATGYSSNQFKELVESFPGEVSVLRVLTMMQRNKAAFPHLAYSHADSERINKVWQAALSTPEPDIQAEASALNDMLSAIAWMPDQAELLLATGIFNLAAVYASGSPQASPGSVANIFQQAIQSHPQDADAWTGWAMTQFLRAESNNGEETPRLQRVTNALMVAASLEKAGRYQPTLHRRLQQFIATLPENKRRELAILQARAALLAGSNEPFDPAVVELANQNLKPGYSGAISGETGTDDIGGIIPVRAFERTGWLGEPIIRVYGEKKDKVSTVLSIDIDEQGYPITVLPFVSSGVHEVDRAAMRVVYGWHFPASDRLRHRFMSLDFVNTELTAYASLQAIQEHIGTLATLVARHDGPGLRKQEAMIRLLQAKLPMNTQSYGPMGNDRIELQKLLDSSRVDQEYYSSAVEKIQGLTRQYYENPDLLLLLAQQQMRQFIYGMRYKDSAEQQDPTIVWTDVLRDARHNFGQVIAMEPTRADAWYGWGLTWVDEDPEKLVGAIAYAQRLVQKADMPKSRSGARFNSPSRAYLDSGRSVDIMSLRLLVGMSLLHERYGWLDILLARINHDYQDVRLADATKTQPMSDSFGYMAPEEVEKLFGQVATRPEPFPASLKRQLPTDPQIAKYPAGVASVNFDQAGITAQTRSLPFFPDVGAQSAGVKTVVINLDVNAQGEPQLVLISASSGVAQYDEAALAAAWLWQFEKQSTGHLQQVTVSFRR